MTVIMLWDEHHGLDIYKGSDESIRRHVGFHPNTVFFYATITTD
jgi:hypothetical protein